MEDEDTVVIKDYGDDLPPMCVEIKWRSRGTVGIDVVQRSQGVMSGWECVSYGNVQSKLIIVSNVEFSGDAKKVAKKHMAQDPIGRRYTIDLIDGAALEEQMKKIYNSDKGVSNLIRTIKEKVLEKRYFSNRTPSEPSQSQ